MDICCRLLCPYVCVCECVQVGVGLWAREIMYTYIRYVDHVFCVTVCSKQGRGGDCEGGS